METSGLIDSPIYNSRIINPFILLIKHKYSYVDVAELLAYAGMKEYEVADQAHWFRQEQVDRFYERLVQLTGNQRIAREAGRYAASPDVLGARRQYILGLVDAASTFEIISKTSADFTRSSRYESRRISSNMVEIVVTPVEPGLEKPYQCENRIGFFEAIVLIFNHKIADLQYFPEIQHLPTIQHPECVFRGGRVCRYLISWDKTLFLFLKKVRNLVPVLLAAANLALAASGQWGILPLSLAGSLCVLLLVTAANNSEKKALKASLNSTKDSIDNLLDQINLNFNNALLTHEIGHRLGSHTHVEEMLPDIAGIMEKRLEYDRGLILLANRDRSRLELRTSYGYSRDELHCLGSLSWRLDGEGAQDVYLSCFREQRPFLVNDLDHDGGSLAGSCLACAKTAGARAFFCCPIVCEDASLGVLAVESVRTRKPLVERDTSLIMGLASIMCISIRNCELNGTLQTSDEELELRVALRTSDLEQSRAKLEMQHEELERTYFDLEEETAQRVLALE